MGGPTRPTLLAQSPVTPGTEGALALPCGGGKGTDEKVLQRVSSAGQFSPLVVSPSGGLSSGHKGRGTHGASILLGVLDPLLTFTTCFPKTPGSNYNGQKTKRINRYHNPFN